MRTLYVSIIVILSVALIIFTIVRNNKDRKNYERQSNDDFKKTPVEL